MQELISVEISCDECDKKFTVEYDGDDETIEDAMWLNSCAVCGLVLCPDCFHKHTFGKCTQDEDYENGK